MRQRDQRKYTGEKAACRTLVKLTPMVNFTNIFCPAFAPIFLHQKSTNLKWNYKKAARLTFVQKATRKMLVKLTPGRYWRSTRWRSRRGVGWGTPSSSTCRLCRPRRTWSAWVACDFFSNPPRLRRNLSHFFVVKGSSIDDVTGNFGPNTFFIS